MARKKGKIHIADRISHRSILSDITRYCWLIVLAGILAAGLLEAWVSLTWRPQYAAEAVVAAEDSDTAQAYVRLLQSDSFVREAEESAGADRAEVRIRAAAEPSSRLITIRLFAASAERVKAVWKALPQCWEELSVSVLRGKKLTVLRAASEPLLRREKPVPKYTGAAAAAGMAAALAMVVLACACRDTVKTASYAKRRLTGEILGQICTDGRRCRERHSQDVQRLTMDVEYYLRDKKSRIVMVTSTGKKEGKTHTALELAKMLAQRGNRVLLADASLEEPSLWKHCDMTGHCSAGLAEYFAGTCTERDIIRYDREKSLYLILNPVPVKAGADTYRSLAQLLKACSYAMDYVILDAPAMDQGTGAALLSYFADATLLVAARDSKRVSEINKTAKQLQEAPSAFLGIVLNRMSGRRPEKEGCTVTLSSVFLNIGKMFGRFWWLAALTALVGGLGAFLRNNHTYSPYYRAQAAFISDAGEDVLQGILQSDRFRTALQEAMEQEEPDGRICLEQAGAAGLYELTADSGRAATARQLLENTLKLLEPVGEELFEPYTITVIKRPLRPKEPYNIYDPWKGVLPWSLAGLAAGLCLLIIPGICRRSLRNETEAESLGISCLGTLPGGNLKRKKAEERYERRMQSIAVRLQHSLQESASGVIMVTSTQPQEGKSSVAWNLARCLSLQGKRVLLLDGDMHDPMLSRWLEKEKKKKSALDVLDILEGRSTAEEAAVWLEERRIFFLGMNSSVSQPMAFVSSGRMKHLLEAFAETMDYVVIDGPPACRAESRAVADCCDLMLYTVTCDKAKQADIRTCLQRMQRSRCRESRLLLCRKIH